MGWLGSTRMYVSVEQRAQVSLFTQPETALCKQPSAPRRVLLVLPICRQTNQHVDTHLQMHLETVERLLHHRLHRWSQSCRLRRPGR